VDIAHSLLKTRAQLERRAVVAAGERGQLLAMLERVEAIAAKSGPKLALLFTGQGAQRLGMGRGLRDAYPAFAGYLEDVCRRFDGLVEQPLLNVVFGDDPALLDQTAYTQPALFALEVAL